jgi:hypothetical protein
MLDAIQQRHANERAFQEALSDWQVATGDPEAYPCWSQFYANALRDALRKANYRRQETLQDMTVTDWRTAVYRELHAEEWFEAPGTEREKQLDRPAETTPVPLAVAAAGNGHHNDNGGTASAGV